MINDKRQMDLKIDSLRKEKKMRKISSNFYSQSTPQNNNISNYYSSSNQMLESCVDEQSAYDEGSNNVDQNSEKSCNLQENEEDAKITCYNCNSVMSILLSRCYKCKLLIYR